MEVSVSPLDPIDRITLPEPYRVPLFDNESPVDISDTGSSGDFAESEL